jgi:GT2 family glycosyltransferase
MLLENSVCVVTVTYGNRWFLLSEVLKSLVIKKYIKKIIVIDNNSEKDIETLCSNLDNRIEVIKFDSNLGSAKGFKVGLSEAYKSECDFIWMLDDDNRPQSNSLEILLEEYKKQSTSRRKIPFSLLSLRTDRTEFLLSLKRGASKGIFPHQNSFLGIHILELPKKIFRKILSRDYRRTRNNQKEIVSVPMAPYGGMFFSKELLAEIGLPNDSFYLYSDDYEFSHRIPKKGGEILLVGKSKIDDIDKSWFIKTNKPYLVSLFETEDDFRVFYGVRNRIYFETKDLVTNNLIYSVNKIFTMTFLYLLSILYKKKKRYKLLKRAITDGQNKQLGKMNFE